MPSYLSNGFQQHNEHSPASSWILTLRPPRCSLMVSQRCEDSDHGWSHRLSRRRNGRPYSGIFLYINQCCTLCCCCCVILVLRLFISRLAWYSYCHTELPFDVLQDTVRKEFEGVTVLSIAHRLHTIAFYDKVGQRPPTHRQPLIGHCRSVTLTQVSLLESLLNLICLLLHYYAVRLML
jgi:hypothetical protein